jgi:ribonuclease P protein component
MRPHSDYVLVGRRAALHRGFAVMLDDLKTALTRLARAPKPQPQSLPADERSTARRVRPD